jgi:hypothetical protein
MMEGDRRCIAGSVAVYRTIMLPVDCKALSQINPTKPSDLGRSAHGKSVQSARRLICVKARQRLLLQI